MLRLRKWLFFLALNIGVIWIFDVKFPKVIFVPFLIWVLVGIAQVYTWVANDNCPWISWGEEEKINISVAISPFKQAWIAYKAILYGPMAYEKVLSKIS